MSTHKSIDRICVIAVLAALVLSLFFVNGERLGIIQSADRAMGYEDRLFDTSQVHTIDITMDDWDGFIETCTEELYSVCDLVIDGEEYPNVGIRGKGNTSLSSVSAMGSRRYSFKVEFDQYDSTKNYYGLDKLSLNNLIQDNTYMKDYLVYRMMGAFGVDAPLCSFVSITVNGEPWGLYLAVEGVEDSFLQRNYGTDPGELYKPDSISFGGGGPGNGKDFDFEEFLAEREQEAAETEDGSSAASGESGSNSSFTPPDMSGGGGSFTPPGMSGGGGSFTPPDMSGGGGSFTPPDMSGDGSFTPPGMSGDGGSFTPPDMSGGGGSFTPPGMSGGGSFTPPDMSGGDGSFSPPDFGGGGGPGGFGMGSADVKLQYIDDDPDSYSNIFSSAKTDVTNGDKKRLIASLKKLGERTELESVVDTDEVLRYFVVHNFVVNSDSYTGAMIHNYYLHEKDGQLAMIPWDYNLAFGTFQAGNAAGAVNDPIDTPLSASDPADRPMWGWIAESEEYTEEYHALFAEFLDTVDVAGMIEETAALIAPYVKEDATAFCTYEEFLTGVETLKSFCRLRTESVEGQLDGTIPSTSEGQKADDSSLIDASGLTLSDMGSMGGGMGGSGGSFGGNNPFGGGNPFGGSGGFPGGSRGEEAETSQPSEGEQGTDRPQMPDGGDFPAEGQSGELPDFGQAAGMQPSGGEPSDDGEADDGEQPAADQSRPSFPGGGSFSGGPPSGVETQTQSGVTTETWLLLGICLAVLAAGLVIACRYRRY